MKHLFLLFFVLSLSPVSGQPTTVNPRYDHALWLVNLNYKAALPAGSLALRYGFINGAGIDVYYKTKKNYLWGLNSNLLFGKSVRDIDYVNIFKDNNGYVFRDDGTPIFITASMRGGQAMAFFGRLFPIFKKKPQLALMLQFGAGFLQHKYLFSAPGAYQFSKEYLKGYDRLSNGFALSQQVGMYNFSLNRLINFNLCLEITEAYTKNKRYYDYATKGTDTKSYLDMMLALKFSWVLPIKARDKTETIYYK